MKRFVLFGVAVVVVVVSAWRIGHAQGQAAAFTIHVEPSDAGLTATCVKGCLWKTASFGCGGPKKTVCKTEITENGVGGVK